MSKRKSWLHPFQSPWLEETLAQSARRRKEVWKTTRRETRKKEILNCWLVGPFNLSFLFFFFCLLSSFCLLSVFFLSSSIFFIFHWLLFSFLIVFLHCFFFKDQHGCSSLRPAHLQACDWDGPLHVPGQVFSWLCLHKGANSVPGWCHKHQGTGLLLQEGKEGQERDCGGGSGSGWKWGRADQEAELWSGEAAKQTQGTLLKAPVRNKPMNKWTKNDFSSFGLFHSLPK